MNEIPNYDEQMAICKQYDPITGDYIGYEKIFTTESIIPIANGGTGATTAVEAFEALDFRGVYRESTDDYNNLTDTGTYLVTSSALNTPDTNTLWYYLKVKRHTIDLTAMIIQECMSIESDSDKILKYHRTKYGNNDWTSWRKDYTSDNELFIDRGDVAQFTSKKLSDAITIGSYFIATLSEFTDKPTVDSSYNYGVLTVSKSITYLTQTLVLTIANTTKLKVFERFININNHTSPSTTGWREIFTNESVIPIANGGTGATTADAARENLLAQRKVENVTYLELGSSRSSAGNAYIDFHSNKGTDYDARILVDSGKILQLQSSAGVRVTDMNNGGIFARNIQYSTTDLTAGSSALTNGRIYLVYE